MIKDYRGLVYFKIKIRLDMRFSYILINQGASCVTHLFANRMQRVFFKS